MALTAAHLVLYCIRKEFGVAASSEAIATATALGLNIETQPEVVAQTRKGLRSTALREIERRLHLTHAELARLLRLPTRSFARRVNAQRLSPSESDALYRIARIYQAALDTLGSVEKATRWLKKPNRALAGAAPLDTLDTEAGAREVEGLLGRIRYGVFS